MNKNPKPVGEERNWGMKRWGMKWWGMKWWGMKRLRTKKDWFCWTSSIFSEISGCQRSREGSRKSERKRPAYCTCINWTLPNPCYHKHTTRTNTRLLLLSNNPSSVSTQILKTLKLKDYPLRFPFLLPKSSTHPPHTEPVISISYQL